MKISLKWLAEMVDLPRVDVLAAQLTAAGLEVESISRPGEALRGVVVAEVIGLAPHPNADRLRITQVSTGPGEARQVVCGAQNFEVGARVPLATPGTVLPGDKRISAAAVRGVDSAGMLCAAQELGLAEKSEGLLLLDASAPLGMPIAEHLGLDDIVLEVNVTPNRPDALSHLGIAREVAAITRVPLRPPDSKPVESDLPAADAVQVRSEDKGCPRYTARVIEGVRIGPSPGWMQARLKACGVRPINHVVDVTNYVMLELGQPLHAFDLDRVSGHRLVARRARAGETLTTLDGKARTLTTDDVVIADAKQAQGLAGVMGGGDSEVAAATTRVVLEAAYFAPALIRRAAKRHGLHTEASHRYERGADPFAIPRALDRAAYLIANEGGQVRKGRVESFEKLPMGTVVGLRYSRLAEVLGVEIPPTEARRILVALGFQVDLESSEQTLFSVPSFRPDILREEDLIEEVVRVWGYDKVPEVLPRGVGTLEVEAAAPAVEQRLRAALAGAGFDEAVNYSFVSPRELEALEPREKPIALTNALSAEQSVMRTTLLPGLLQNVSRAVRHQTTAVRLYELGRAYLRDPRGGQDGRPAALEPLRLAGVLFGRRDGRSWNLPDASMDFFDVKGAVEAVLRSLGIAGARFAAAEHPALHPRAAAALWLPGALSEVLAGCLGEVHPTIAEALDVPRGVFLFELEFAVLEAAARLKPAFQSLPRHPAVLRDLAVLVPVELAHDQVRQAIREAGGAWVEDAVVFDQYTGAPVPEGKKNLAFALRYRAADRTLTDVEVAEVHERVVKVVNERFGGQLRGSWNDL